MPRVLRGMARDFPWITPSGWGHEIEEEDKEREREREDERDR